MKGVIFNSLFDAVVEMGGEELWDELLARSGLVGSYTSLGTYDDGELLALVGAAAEVLGRSVDETVELVGELVAPRLAGRHPSLVAEHEGTVSLLCSLNDVIHPEVLKLYPNASVPDFTTLRRDGNELDLLYRSERNLPALAAGLIRGAANLYDERVVMDVEPADDGWVFRLRFHPAGSAPVESDTLPSTVS